MTPTDVMQTVKDIVTDQLGCEKEEVTMEASLSEDLGADSLDGVEVLMALEESFGIEITDDELSSESTVQAIVNLVTAKLKEKGTRT